MRKLRLLAQIRRSIRRSMLFALIGLCGCGRPQELTQGKTNSKATAVKPSTQEFATQKKQAYIKNPFINWLGAYNVQLTQCRDGHEQSMTSDQKLPLIDLKKVTIGLDAKTKTVLIDEINEDGSTLKINTPEIIPYSQETEGRNLINLCPAESAQYNCHQREFATQNGHWYYILRQIDNRWENSESLECIFEIISSESQLKLQSN